MAKILQPKNVVRLVKGKNPHNCWGYKWHSIATNKNRQKRRKGKAPRMKKQLTQCRIVIVRTDTWEASRFGDVSAKDLCSTCFGGLDVMDGKGVVRY